MTRDDKIFLIILLSWIYADILIYVVTDVDTTLKCNIIIILLLCLYTFLKIYLSKIKKNTK